MMTGAGCRSDLCEWYRSDSILVMSEQVISSYDVSA
jgi:hypothetical protein